MNRPGSRALRTFRPGPWPVHGLILGLVLVLSWLAGNQPDRFRRLMREDGWGEWATFLAFLLAGILAVRLIRRGVSGVPDRIALVGLAAFCFFVAGEEISWGQRLLGYRPPDLFLEKNYQQEANLHNLLKDIFDTRWMVLIVALFYGVVLAIAGLWKRFPRALAPAVSFLPWFGTVAILEWKYPWHLTGEFAELVLGVAFLADLMERRVRGRKRPSLLGEIALPVGALAGAVLIAPLTDVIVYRHAMKQIPTAERQLQSLQVEITGPDVIRARLFRKRWVHKRIFTAATSGRYLAMPEEGFFLDPWNQAYWIAFHRTGKRSGRILLYSFGPNRRRDSETSLLKTATTSLSDIVKGDDVGILFGVQAEGP